MSLFGPNVAAMQKKGDVQGLMRALGGSKPEVARDALDALVGMGLAPDLLMAALQQKAWPFWMAVRRRLDAPIAQSWVRTDRKLWADTGRLAELEVRFLGRFAQPLLAALMEGTDEVKTAALEGLRRLDRQLLDPPGAAALIEVAANLLAAPSSQVRAGAVAILEAAGWSPRADSFGLLYWLEKGQAGSLARLGPAAVEPLVAILDASLRAYERDRAVTAAAALGELGDARAVKSLAAGMGSLAGRTCIEALGRIDAPEADEALLGGLKGGLAQDLAALTEALLRKGPAMAARAAQSVGGMGTEGKRVVLRLCAETRDPDALRTVAGFMLEPALRADAAAVLAQCGFEPGRDEGSIEYCLETGDFERLVEAGEQAVPVLARHLEATNAGQRDALIGTLVRIGAPSCRALGTCLQGARDAQLEQAISEALIDIGGDEARGAFERLLESGAKSALAVRALDSLGFEPRRDALGAAYHEEKGEWRACLESGPEGVRRILPVLLNGDGRGVCAAVAEMPREQIDPLVGRLEQALLGEEPHSGAAAAALDALGWKPARDECSAGYWLAKGNFEKCAQVGAPAFAPLAGRLKNTFGKDLVRLLSALGSIPNPAGIPLVAEYLTAHGREIRTAAGRAVVRLCESCTLSEEQKLDVLRHRGAITKSHTDGRGAHTDIPSHYDQTSWAAASDCNSGSFSSHTDGAARPGYGRHKDATTHMDEGIGLAFPL
jgi:hypothetical protein